MPLGLLDAAPRQRHRAGRRSRSPTAVRRRVRGRRLPDRLGHLDQHERQRGDRQPRHRDPRRHARRQAARAPERSRQHGAEHQRRLPDRASTSRRWSAIETQLLPALRAARRGVRGARPPSSPTSSRRGARTCRTPCRSRSARSSAATPASCATASRACEHTRAAPGRAADRRHGRSAPGSTRSPSSPAAWSPSCAASPDICSGAPRTPSRRCRTATPRVELSGALKTVAVGLMKIANDLRLADLRAAHRPERDRAAGDPAGLEHHAGQGEPGDSRGREPWSPRRSSATTRRSRSPA